MASVQLFLHILESEESYDSLLLPSCVSKFILSCSLCKRVFSSRPTIHFNITCVTGSSTQDYNDTDLQYGDHLYWFFSRQTWFSTTVGHRFFSISVKLSSSGEFLITNGNFWRLVKLDFWFVIFSTRFFFHMRVTVHVSTLLSRLRIWKLR